MAKIEKQYEQLLKVSIDVYSGEPHHVKESKNARKIILETNKEALRNFPGIKINIFQKYMTSKYEGINENE